MSQGERPQVLIIDDQLGEILWLLLIIKSYGFDPIVATNEKAARAHLAAIADGRESYALAIIDVMVALRDLEDLIDLDEDFLEESTDTGIRLCRYARQELGIAEAQLPIGCLTVRDDDDVKEAMSELAIPLFHRVPQHSAESIRSFLEQHLKHGHPADH